MKNVFIILIVITIVSLSLSFLPYEFLENFVDENGPVENTQFILYGLGALAAWFFAIRREWSNGLTGGAILFIFMLRELDFHKRFTAMSITKTKFFVSPEVPLTEKLIGGMAIAATLILIYLFIRGNSKKLLNHLKAGETWAVSTFMGIILLAASVLLDGGKRYLTSLNIILTDSGYLLIVIFEEVVELAIPALLFFALLQWSRGFKLKRATREYGVTNKLKSEIKRKTEEGKEAL